MDVKKNFKCVCVCVDYLKKKEGYSYGIFYKEGKKYWLGLFYKMGKNVYMWIILKIYNCTLFKKKTSANAFFHFISDFFFIVLISKKIVESVLPHSLFFFLMHIFLFRC